MKFVFESYDSLVSCINRLIFCIKSTFIDEILYGF